MEAKRIVLESDQKVFKEKVLEFVAEKGWTISNVNDAMYEVNEYLENNAVLKEVNTKETVELTKSGGDRAIYAIVDKFNEKLVEVCLTKEEAARRSMSVRTPTKIIESEIIF